MSIAASIASTANFSSNKEKNDIFQDLPLLDRNIRLTVMELKQSDKQIVNELVYRWCRILTRFSKKSQESQYVSQQLQEIRKVLIIDLIGSINPVRLATVLRRDEKRMRSVGVVRGCKMNSTFVTLNSYLGHQAIPSSLKLVVIYQDEFFIMKTLNLLKDYLPSIKCQVLFIVPWLDRHERDVLNLISNYQILRAEFFVNRRDIGPAPPEVLNDSYQTYLNQVYFQRSTGRSQLERITGELREDGLYLTDAKKKRP